jgi:hypothetical protein
MMNMPTFVLPSTEVVGRRSVTATAVGTSGEQVSAVVHMLVVVIGACASDRGTVTRLNSEANTISGISHLSLWRIFLFLLKIRSHLSNLHSSIRIGLPEASAPAF